MMLTKVRNAVALEIDCDDDDFYSGSTMSMQDENYFEIEQQLFASMMGWC